MKMWASVVAWCCLGVGSVQAQEQYQSEESAPGGRSEQVSELEAFVGHWVSRGESRPSPDAAFSPLEGEETCEWFSGGTSVVCRETLTDANGTTDSLYILAYDPTRRHYTVYGTDGNGAIISGIGTVRDGVWDWDAEVRSGEMVLSLKYAFQPGDDGSRNMIVQADAGEGQWVEVIRTRYSAGE